MDKINAEVFLTVAETGSFRGAADVLGYTQAGISYIISSMEKETGLTLFTRERSGVRLSPEGKELLPSIKQLDILERQFDQTVTELNGLKKGSLKVQIFNSISVYWIPGIVRKFHDDYPGIEIDLISEEDSARAEEMVLSGEVDCGFFRTDVNSDIDYQPLMEENVKALVAFDHPLAALDKFPIDKLGDYPYICMKADKHRGIIDIFKNHGQKANIVFTLENDYAAMSMAKEGLGYCIFPDLLMSSKPEGVKSMDFDVPVKRVIGIGTASRQSCSKACRKFMEYTKEWVDNYLKERK